MRRVSRHSRQLRRYVGTRQEIQNPFVGNTCFFCGADNHHGLQLKFYRDDETQGTSTG
jgi:hypothetical protein